MVLNFAASDAALARSAAFRPAGRSYTTTAENTLGDWNFDCRASTFVDCACAGSHDCASFLSAPVSLPASEPATARMMIQRIRTTHFPRRPLGKLTIPRPLLTQLLLRSAVLAHASNTAPSDRHRGRKLPGLRRQRPSAGDCPASALRPPPPRGLLRPPPARTPPPKPNIS